MRKHGVDGGGDVVDDGRVLGVGVELGSRRRGPRNVENDGAEVVVDGEPAHLLVLEAGLVVVVVIVVVVVGSAHHRGTLDHEGGFV